MNGKSSLKLLVGIDASVWLVTSIYPAFRESSYFELIHFISSESILGNKIAMAMFVISVPLLPLSWAGILTLKTWGRSLYVLSAAITLIGHYFTRNTELDFGLLPAVYSFGLMLNGFFIALLYCGPPRRLFSAKGLPVASLDDVQFSASPGAMLLFRTPSDLSELAVIRSILDEGRISYHIQNEGLGSLFEGPSLPLLNQRRIMVPEEQYQAATELLNSHMEQSQDKLAGALPEESQSKTGLRILAIILIGVAVMLFLLKLSNI